MKIQHNTSLQYLENLNIIYNFNLTDDDLEDIKIQNHLLRHFLQLPNARYVKKIDNKLFTLHYIENRNSDHSINVIKLAGDALESMVDRLPNLQSYLEQEGSITFFEATTDRNNTNFLDLKDSKIIFIESIDNFKDAQQFSDFITIIVGSNNRTLIDSFNDKFCNKPPVPVSNLKSEIKDFILDEYKLFNTFFSQASEIERIQNLLNTFLYLEDQKIWKKSELNLDDPTNLEIFSNLSKGPLGLITLVFEFNNIRIFKYSTAFQLNNYLIFKSTDSDYDYIDVGRFFKPFRDFQNIYDHAVTDFTKVQSFGNIIWEEIPAIIPQYSIIKDEFFSSKHGINSPARHVSNMEIKGLIKNHMRRLQTAHQSHSQGLMLAKKLKSKLALLKTYDGELKLNDITYRYNEIEYQKQRLSYSPNTKKDEYWVHDLMAVIFNNLSLEEINFDVVRDAFINTMDTKIKYDTNKIEGILGDVEFKLTKKVTSATRFYINGNRINKDEIVQCLTDALCYQTKDQYDTYLKQISSCSLRIHHYLHNGLKIELEDPFQELSETGTVIIKLHIEREKNTNFLKLDKDTLLRIHDTNSFLKLEEQKSLLEFMGKISNPKMISGLKPTDIRTLIIDGERAYRELIEKNEKLLRDTEKLFNLETVENVTLQDGNHVKEGYIIEGGFRKYIIDKQNKNNVYAYPEGNYICMIDKNNNASLGVDRLVNRIFALKNDKLVSEEVHTLTFGQ